MGFARAEGFAERVIYREFFPRGLTALDDLDESTLGTRPNLSHVTAREEVQALLGALKLPIDEKGKRRAAARSEWFASMDRPIEVHDSWIDGLDRANRLLTLQPVTARRAPLRRACASWQPMARLRPAVEDQA